MLTVKYTKDCFQTRKSVLVENCFRNIFRFAKKIKWKIPVPEKIDCSDIQRIYLDLCFLLFSHSLKYKLFFQKLECSICEPSFIFTVILKSSQRRRGISYNWICSDIQTNAKRFWIQIYPVQLYCFLIKFEIVVKQVQFISGYRSDLISSILLNILLPLDFATKVSSFANIIKFSIFWQQTNEQIQVISSYLTRTIQQFMRCSLSKNNQRYQIPPWRRHCNLRW